MKRILIPFLVIFLRNYLESKESIKSRDSNEQMLSEFYNYKYWREEQRKQLTVSSNIFFTFNVATLAFIIKYLIDCTRNNDMNYIIINLFLLSICLFGLAVISYAIFNLLRLSDYRKTAKYIKDKMDYSEISDKTKHIGKVNWMMLYIQIGFSTVGFLLVLFTFYQIILYKY